MKYKLSYYTIFSKVSSSIYIIYATRTGASLVINDKNYDSILNGRFDEMDRKLLFKLLELCAIVPEDENELKAVVEENQNALEESSQLYYVLQPTANCQLGCAYCGQQHNPEQYKEEFDERIINRIRNKLELAPDKFKGLKIAWFGSEPLLGIRSIKRLTPKLQELAREKKIAYDAKMVTNGLLLKKDLFVELVTVHNVSFFEVTLDGTAEFHDKRRFVKSGEKSFDLIFQNLLDIFNLPEYEKLNAKVSIRCNVDATNYSGVVPLIEKMREHNFHEKLANFYVAPIHSWGNDAHKMSLEKQEFSAKQIDWLIALYENDFSPWLIPGRKKEVCMAVKPDSELIDANGGIYNCTEVPYVPLYKGSEYELENIMNVDAKTQFEHKPLQNWNEIILNKSMQIDCDTCKMLPVCGGACPKSWKENIVPCPDAKFNIQDRLVLSYLISQKKIKAFNL